MPCRDYYDDHPELYFKEQSESKDKEIRELKERVAFTESALCAVITLTKDTLWSIDKTGKNKPFNISLEKDPNGSNYLGAMWDVVDYKEAGITKTELMRWYDNHLKRDKIARDAAKKAEETKKRKEEVKKQVKAIYDGLTPEQKRALSEIQRGK